MLGGNGSQVLSRRRHGRPRKWALQERRASFRLQSEISRAAIVALFYTIIHPNVDNTCHEDMTQSSLLGLPNCWLFRGPHVAF